MEPIDPRPLAHLPSATMDTTELKAMLSESLEELTSEGILTDEQKEEIRNSIVDKVNAAVNIPVIGEAIERVIFMFALKLIERFASNFLKKKVIGGIG